VRDHTQPRPFVYALKQALKQPQLWQIHSRSVVRDQLQKWCTTQQEWRASVNDVVVEIVWLRVGDGHCGNDGKELELRLDGQVVKLEPYEFEKLFNGCERLQQHFLQRVERSKKKRLAAAIAKLEETAVVTVSKETEALLIKLAALSEAPISAEAKVL
jgi:hypothetical protein